MSHPYQGNRRLGSQARPVIKGGVSLLTSALLAACTSAVPTSPAPTSPTPTRSVPSPTAAPVTPASTVTPGPVTASPTAAESPAARLQASEGLALGPDGRIYVSDFAGNRVFRIDVGSLTVVAGNGNLAIADSDGVPAMETGLGRPVGIVFDPAGNLYIAAHGGNRVLRVDSLDATITTFAGGGGNTGGSPAPQAGDAGPATAARLGGPAGLALDGVGNLYVAEMYGHRIRRVDTAGVITTVAGTGVPASGDSPSGDGQLATEVALGDPFHLTVAPSGDVYWAEAPNSRVYRLDSAGILHHVAGTGQAGYSGDGGPATEAQLTWPNGIAVAADGTVYVSEGEGGHRIRRIDPAGVITTYAGTGVAGFSGDGGPATEAQLNSAFGLLLDAAENLYVADGRNGRVRRIDAAGVITTIAGP